MRMRAFAICLLIYSITGLAASADLTGTWETKYDFVTGPETTTVVVQQVGENIIGSFLVVPDNGEKYSGIVFGGVEGDSVKIYYLTSRAKSGSDPLLIITFADAHIADLNTLEGNFYVQDSDMNSIPAIPFRAVRK